MATDFVKLAARVMKPVAGFCLRRGLKIQEMTEALKIALLKAVEEDLESKNLAVNVSRLSVATGLHRRDVMRLWRDEAEPKDINLLVKIIGQWQHNPKFTTKARPRVLSYEGRCSEFAELVTSVTRDVNPYTVLFELERAKMVERSATGIALCHTVLKPAAQDYTNGIELLALDMSDLAEAVDENLFAPSKIPHLHIRTSYDNIPATALPKLRAWILEEGTKFQQRVEKFLSRYDRDTTPTADGRGRARISVGTFSYSTETERAESEKEAI